MPDVYATIADIDVATQERLAEILELRAADGQQRAMLDSYLSEIDFRPGARVLEWGRTDGDVALLLEDAVHPIDGLLGLGGRFDREDMSYLFLK